MSLDDERPSLTTLPTIHQHPLAYLVGLQGVALMKAFAGEFDQAFTLARLAEVRALLDSAAALGEGTDVPPMATVDAYNGWADTYDDPGNDLLEIEERVVRPILDRMPAGVAVDAACGTGRHAAYLSGRGHDVSGFDISPRMLAVAATRVPAGRFGEADVRSLPVPASSTDLLINALALTHVQDLGPVFREAARVLRPGGHFVVSDTRSHFIGSLLYPLVRRDHNGDYGYLPSWRHATSDYLGAALRHGFAVRQCHEPLRPWPVVDLPAPPDPASAQQRGQPPDVWELHSRAAEAANATYRDEPCLIVWDFQLEQV